MTDEELVAVLRWRGSALQEGAFPAAADRIAQLTAERDRLRAALTEWDALIEHQYSGSREAMSAMTSVAQRTAKLLKGATP